MTLVTKTGHETGLQGPFTQVIAEHFHWMNCCLRTSEAVPAWQERRRTLPKPLDKSNGIGAFQDF